MSHTTPSQDNGDPGFDAKLDQMCFEHFRQYYDNDGEAWTAVEELKQARSNLLGPNAAFKLWTLTPEASRKALVENQLMMVGPGAWDTELEAQFAGENAIEIAKEHCLAGRMIWFDRAPDVEVIRREAQRGISMMRDRFFGHPFKDGWVCALNHSVVPERYKDLGAKLDLPETNMVGGEIMVVTPFEDNPGAHIFHFSANVLHGKHGLMPTFEMEFHITPTGVELYPVGMATAEEIGDGLDNARFEFQMDLYSHMVFFALMALNTTSMPIETVQTSAKLNRARVASGKLPLPDYTFVHTDEYITALTHGPREQGEGHGGHASPAPHLRRGHRRWLDAEHTRSTWVRDCLVNVRKGDYGGIRRLFYDASKLN